MPPVRFRYIPFRGTKAPIIPIEVRKRGEWQEIWAYVDSGASFSVFDRDEALSLGLRMEDGKAMMVVVGDGSYIPIYLHRLRVRIGRYEIRAEIGFSDRLGVGFNILGRKDIFEAFRVCFDDRDGVVSFQRKK